MRPASYLLQGDARALPLADQSVQTVVTSPPYWGLRSYGTTPRVWDGDDGHAHEWGDEGKSAQRLRNGEGSDTAKQAVPVTLHPSTGAFCPCGAWRGELGLEPTPELYVAHLVAVFREVRRVLRDDGVCWLNLGDSYATGAGKVGDHPGGGAQGARWKEYGPARAQVPDGKNPGAGIPTYQPNRMPIPGLKPKDLCGIPWRVALALQAPEYQGRIKAEKDRTWLAALVDGEGCITILQTISPHGSGDSFPPVLQVRMCDLGPIEHAARITGLGTASPRQDPPSQGGNHGSYQWRLSGRKASETVAELYPYLIGKRKQAVIAWNHQQVRESYHVKRGMTIPRPALEKAMLCRDLIRRANRRESVDVPTWMQEPPALYRPGWYLRSDCIWSKPNPMPESITDRPTKAHEYLFLLTKRERYYYDAEAIKERQAESTHERAKYPWRGVTDDGSNGARTGSTFKRMAETGEPIGTIPADGSRNRRSVWTIATQPYPEAHFATFPEALVEPCILAGTSARGACPTCGAPWGREVERSQEYGSYHNHEDDLVRGQRHEKGRKLVGSDYYASYKGPQTTGWSPACACPPAEPVPCRVLDPFAGSGTTVAVAERLGRVGIGLELKAEYLTLAKRRTVQAGLL